MWWVVFSIGSNVLFESTVPGMVLGFIGRYRRSQARFTRIARRQVAAESALRRSFKDREQRIMAGLRDGRVFYAALGIDRDAREAAICHDHLVAVTTALIRHYASYLRRFSAFETRAFAADYIADLRLTLMVEDVCLAALFPEQLASGYADEEPSQENAA